jgi:uncharacterized protein with HEPN domain
MRRGSRGESREIQGHETIESIFGNAQNRDTESLKDDPTYREFNKKIREIHSVAENMMIPIGEALQMMLYNYGYWWDTIPWNRMAEMKEFVLSNGETRYKILDEDLHKYLLTTGYYKMGRGIAPKEMTAAFCRNTFEMMDDKRPSEEILEFGRSIQFAGNYRKPEKSVWQE